MRREISHPQLPECGPLGGLFEDWAESVSTCQMAKLEEVIADRLRGKGCMDPAMHRRDIGYVLFVDVW